MALGAIGEALDPLFALLPRIVPRVRALAISATASGCRRCSRRSRATAGFGAMLPISVDVAHIHVMLVGDGAVARRRLALLDEAGAEALEIYAPDPGPELAAMAGARLRQRFPLPAEIARAQLVFVAGVPQLVASDICRVANAAGVLVNVEDNRRRSDFHSAAVIRRGDLTVAISTNGKSPGLASLMRRVLEHRVGPEWELRLDQSRHCARLGAPPGRPGHDRPPHPGMGRAPGLARSRRARAFTGAASADTLSYNGFSVGGNGMAVIAIIAQGMMGAGVGRRLHESGATVRTLLSGRSASSAERARAAGMEPAVDEQALLAGADFFLSILPPGEAEPLARRLAPALTALDPKADYVDCNAVSPQTAMRIGAAIAPTGADFVDGGIIGGPPRPGYSPTIYASGPTAGQTAVFAIGASIGA